MFLCISILNIQCIRNTKRYARHIQYRRLDIGPRPKMQKKYRSLKICQHYGITFSLISLSMLRSTQILQPLFIASKHRCRLSSNLCFFGICSLLSSAIKIYKINNFSVCGNNLLWIVHTHTCHKYLSQGNIPLCSFKKR